MQMLLSHSGGLQQLPQEGGQGELEWLPQCGRGSQSSQKLILFLLLRSPWSPLHKGLLLPAVSQENVGSFQIPTSARLYQAL